VPDVPWALDRVILRLLEKDPDQRFQTAAEVAEALLGAASRPAAEAAPAQRTPSVAVLPFTPLGQHALDADFGLGLADATITDLALVRSLLVRPTSSIVQYRDRPTDVLAAGRELSVDAVVSCRRSRCSSPHAKRTGCVARREAPAPRSASTCADGLRS
jgi:hypothetical protein